MSEDKSYVSMEKKVCIVCGEEYATDSLLMDRRLKNRFNKYTVTGAGLCKEHEKMHDEGYVALVETTTDSTSDRMKLEEAVRTGVVCHIKREVLAQLTGDDAPAEPMVYVQVGVVDKIKGIMKESIKNS